MTTEIISNGAGNAQPIETLFARLESDTLDPTFEAFGNFITTDGLPPRMTDFFGNFWTYSHVFNVVTDDPDLINRLSTAIRTNQSTDAYKKARAEHIASVAAERQRKAALEAKRIADYRARMLRYGRLATGEIPKCPIPPWPKPSQRPASQRPSNA